MLHHDRGVDNMTQSLNEVLLEGLPQAAPAWSHDNHGTRFFRFFLRIPRLSGTPDTLPVLLPEFLAGEICAGTPVRIRGQLRSFNNRSGVGNKLVLAVYAQELQEPLGEPCNQITLTGSLCKPPILRRTPLGRSICDMMLAAPRHYGRADYLPVIAWGQLALQASRLQTSDTITLSGRIQSRSYHKVTDSGTEERTAYEISMMQLLEP